MKSKHIIHLYHRIGFGITPQQVEKLSQLSLKENIDLLFNQSKKTTHITVNTDELISIKNLAIEKVAKKKMFIKANRKLISKLNQKWYQQLYNSEELLRDKMTLFWANHFVCSDMKIIRTQQYLSILKQHSLGNFKDFVLAISKCPLMILYLNNQQNKKQHPNENFARELMELFTLGNGHYSEQDVKESARAFTGWACKGNDFLFKKRFHDFGSKTFFGKTGNFDGSDIINLILEHPQCAYFISEKIYKHFVNPVPNKVHIQKMEKVFRKNYDIAELMHFTLTANWFYDDENIGIKIKSPVDLLVGIHKILPYSFKKQKYFMYLQFNLGQKLLQPPNVAGWPGDKQWIDANTIMLRLKLASTIAQQKKVELAAEVAFEDNFDTINKRKNNRSKRLLTEVNWKKVDENMKNTHQKNWQEVLLGSSHLSDQTKDFIANINTHNTKDFCIAMMSLPEYQMC